MRSNEEQTQYILALRDQKLKEISRRRKIVLGTSLSLAACFVVVVGIGFFSFGFARANSAAPKTSDETPSISEFSNYSVNRIIYFDGSSSESGSPTSTQETEKTEATEFSDETVKTVNDLNYSIEGHCDLLILNKATDPQALKDNALEILKIEGNDYEVYSLKDLPANISFYAKNSSSEGFLFTENKLISLSEFSSVVNLNGFNSSNSEYSAVISKLGECLSGAEQAQKEYGEFNKKFTINFSTQNSLSLNLEVSLSNEGCCVLKILPDEGRSVLAYTIVSFDKTKCDELYNLLG